MNLGLSVQQKPQTVSFNKSIVEVPRFDKCLKAINMVHQTQSSTPRGLMLLGYSGTGKSTVIKQYKHMFSLNSDPVRDRQTVVIVETPPSNSVDMFYSAILQSLGDVGFDKGRAIVKRKRIERLITELCVELLIFDEIQNLLPVNAESSTLKVSNTIKSLMNTLKIPMVLVGLPSACELLRRQSELRSRFQRTIILEPFSFKAGRDNKDFIQYLEKLQRHISVETVDIFSSEMAKRFYAASSGYVREISKIIDITLQRGGDKILTERDYGIAFGMACSQDLVEHFNPFLDDMLVVDAYLDRYLKSRKS